MKTYYTIILLVLLAINFTNAQNNSANIRNKKSVIEVSPRNSNILVSNNKKSINPITPLKTNNVSTLNLTALIQGYFNGSVMNSSNPILVDVELHDATTMEGIESQIGTLSSSGIGSFTFSSAVDGVPYYLVVKSPNTIAVWSALPVTFISGSLNYNFTSSITQAYGSNLKLLGSVYCLFSGDVNQDGLVDLSDMIAIDNDIINHLTGNVNTDVNGDGTVDLNDLTLVDNNNMIYVSEIAPPGNPSSTLNYAGQTYHTILIGTQYWLKENLNVGNIIAGTQAQISNGIIEKYCYGDLAANCLTHGGLYQWNEAIQYSASGGKVQGICPTGWHIPDTTDFSILSTSVAGNSTSLKSVGQGGGIGAGTNASGFSALLAGQHNSTVGSFTDLGFDGYFWSSTEYTGINAYYIDLASGNKIISKSTSLQATGFSVRCVKDGWILLHSPNGGESWGADSIHNIIWTSSNIKNTKIELTTDNGTTWTTIIGSTPATADNYSWTIPNTPSAQCRVKLTDVNDTTIKSISANTFTIWVPTISLSSPNGGENWKVGGIDSIKWSSSHMTNVRIDYSTNDGVNWTTIIGSTSASAGYYAWTIPFTPSVNCKVRIVDIADTTKQSISSNIFTISNPPCPGLATLVYGGQTYNTVQIGNQCWLKENLNIGTMIDSALNQSDNSVIEKYCYRDNPDSCTIYGGLYQWAEAVQYQNGATNFTSPNPAFSGNVKGICPTGWHIPDTTEFGILTRTVNNDGNSLKAVGQGAYIGAGTDLSGFSALLAGTRYSDGSFGNVGLYDYFQSSTEANVQYIYYIDLGVDFNFIVLANNPKNYGRSIRCIKDSAL